MRHPWQITCRSIVASAAIIAAACGGGGGSPSAPSGGSGGSSVPTNIRITAQRILFASNEVSLAWDGNASSYRIAAGTAPGGSESLSVEVNGNSYNWTAPRTEAVYFFRVQAIVNGQAGDSSVELPIYTADMRNIIDAIFFHAGPMSDSPNLTPPGSLETFMWADGTRIRVIVSNEAGEGPRANAQRFADDYASLGGGITATTELTNENFRNVLTGDYRTFAEFDAAMRAEIPDFTVFTRVLNPYCGGSALGCAYYGPTFDRSLITLAAVNTGAQAVEHEMGHVYGMGHVRATAALRNDVNFMMNPFYLVQHMSEPEKTAIMTARQAGMRPGWTRSQALAAGLVLNYTPGMYHPYGGLSVSVGPKGQSYCPFEDRLRGR